MAVERQDLWQRLGCSPENVRVVRPEPSIWTRVTSSRSSASRRDHPAHAAQSVPAAGHADPAVPGIRRTLPPRFRAVTG